MPSNNFFFCAEKYTLSGWRKGVGWPHVRQSSAHLITRGKSSTKFGAVFTCGLETPTTLNNVRTAAALQKEERVRLRPSRARARRVDADARHRPRTFGNFCLHLFFVLIGFSQGLCPFVQPGVPQVQLQLLSLGSPLHPVLELSEALGMILRFSLNTKKQIVKEMNHPCKRGRGKECVVDRLEFC